MKTYRVLTLVIALALVLSACNLPTTKPTETANPNAVFTAAAQTVEAQLTQNALLNPTNPPATVAPPTNTPPAQANTPIPSITPAGLLLATATSAAAVQPTSTCDAAQFVTDVSVPDGTSFTGGTSFTKTWRVKNIGTCTWNSTYTLIFDSGDKMGGPSSQGLASSVGPGQSVDISVNLQAPSADGTYRGYWGLKNASGARLPVAGGTNMKTFYVEIKVGSGVTGGATPTNSSNKFAVIHVNFTTSRSGACASTSGKYIVTATVETNNPGTVTYTWVRSDGATGPSMSGSLTYANAGTQTINFEWTTTVTSGLWVDLYIDNPNHQQFGRADLICT